MTMVPNIPNPITTPPSSPVCERCGKRPAEYCGWCDECDDAANALGRTALLGTVSKASLHLLICDGPQRVMCGAGGFGENTTRDVRLVTCDDCLVDLHRNQMALEEALEVQKKKTSAALADTGSLLVSLRDALGLSSNAEEDQILESLKSLRQKAGEAEGAAAEIADQFQAFRFRLQSIVKPGAKESVGLLALRLGRIYGVVFED